MYTPPHLDAHAREAARHSARMMAYLDHLHGDRLGYARAGRLHGDSPEWAALFEREYEEELARIRHEEREYT